MSATAAPAAAEQMPLFPERLLTLGNMELVPLERFPENALLESPPPTPALIESIRRWGVLEPILVRAVGGGLDHGDPKFLVSGRRRLKALRLLADEYRERLRKLSASVPADTLLSDETVPGYRAVYERMREFQRVPCRVVSDPEGVAGDGRTEALLLTANAVRADNPQADFRALSLLLARFIAQGLSDREALGETAKASGLAPGTIKQRLRLLALSPDLQDDFMAGRIGYQVALAASSLGPESQALFASMVDGGQAPTLELVKQAKRDAVKQFQADLFDALPEAPEPPEAPAGPGRQDDVESRARFLAEQLADIKMPITQEAAGVIRDLLAILEDHRIDAENRSLNDG